MVRPMRFEGMLILNLPIECPRFDILPEIEGGSNATSIEVYGRIDARGTTFYPPLVW